VIGVHPDQNCVIQQEKRKTMQKEVVKPL